MYRLRHNVAMNMQAQALRSRSKNQLISAHQTLASELAWSRPGGNIHQTAEALCAVSWALKQTATVECENN